jgi:hypothetical protein
MQGVASAVGRKSLEGAVLFFFHFDVFDILIKYQIDKIFSLLSQQYCGHIPSSRHLSSMVHFPQTLYQGNAQ